MSNNNVPTYPEQLSTEVDNMATFLCGRKQKFTTEANLEYGMPLFGKPYSTGEREYTVKDVENCVINMLDVCRNATTGNPHGTLATWFTDGEVNTGMTRASYALAVRQTNRNGKLLVVAFANAGTKPFTPKLNAMRDFKLAQDGADVFTVKGMKGKFATYKNAVGAGARKLHAAAWKAANADNDQEARNAVKALVQVSKNGKAYSKAPKSTKAPAASVSVSKAQAVTMAKAMGAPASCNTKAKATKFLAGMGLNV